MKSTQGSQVGRIAMVSLLLLALGLASANVNADLGDGLISHYAFDGNAYDSGSSGNHGSLLGGVGFVNDAAPVWGGSQSILFDGVDDLVSLAAPWALHAYDDYTVSMWLKASHVTDEYLIYSDHPSDPGMFILSDSRYHQSIVPFEDHVSYPQATAPGVYDNRWHHLTFVRTRTGGSSTFSAYVDGQHTGTQTMPTVPQAASETAIGGSSPNSPDIYHRRWPGQLDDVRLYDRALTNFEIGQLAGAAPVSVTEYFDAASFASAVGSPKTVVDFESFGNGTPVSGDPVNITGDEWSNQGVVFNPLSPSTGLTLRVDSSAWDPTSGQYGLHATPTNSTSYQLTFDQPVYAVGMSICDSESTNADKRLEVFDPSGNMIASSPIPGGAPGSNANFFKGFASATPIGRIDVHGVDPSGEAILLDDVVFNAIPRTEQVDRDPAPEQICLVQPSSDQLRVITNGGDIDPRKPTVVLTHGWNMGGAPAEQYFAPILSSLGNAGIQQDWNIVAWQWNEDADTLNLGYARSRTAAQGQALADALAVALVEVPRWTDPSFEYDQPMHFIGHSLGTLVNAEAVDALHAHSDLFASGFEPERTQVTLLDDAEIANVVPTLGLRLTVTPGLTATYDAPWAKAIPEAAIWIDSYISAVGWPREQAHNIFLSPADLGIVDYHMYPIEWYAKSISDPNASPIGFGMSFENGTIHAATTPTFYVQNRATGELSLIPVDEEAAIAYWTGSASGSLVSTLLDLAAIGGSVLTVGTVRTDVVEKEIDDVFAFTLRLILEEHSPAYAWVPVAVPADAQWISFEFMFENVGNDDFLTFGISDDLLFAIEGQYIDDGMMVESGLLDISAYAGQDVELFFGLNSDGIAGGQMTIEGITFHSIPEPTTALLVGLGGLGLVRRRRAA